jgi:hypothetical protein
MPNQPLVLKYPLDLSGHNTNNLVLAEPHILPDGVNRAIVPQYGAFYTGSLVVREVVSGRILTPRVDYHAIQLYQEATQRSGLEVCGAVAVINPEVDSEIELDYQAIGGDYAFSVTAMKTVLDTLDLDQRPVVWADLLARPTEFPPAPHIHDAGDLYGFEYLVEAIDRLREAQHPPSRCELSETGCAIEELRDWGHELDARISRLGLTTHILSKAHAHGLNCQHLGLSQLTNAPLSTLTDVINVCDLTLHHLIKDSQLSGYRS